MFFSEHSVDSSLQCLVIGWFYIQDMRCSKFSNVNAIWCIHRMKRMLLSHMPSPQPNVIWIVLLYTFAGDSLCTCCCCCGCLVTSWCWGGYNTSPLVTHAALRMDLTSFSSRQLATDNSSRFCAHMINFTIDTTIGITSSILTDVFRWTWVRWLPTGSPPGSAGCPTGSPPGSAGWPLGLLLSQPAAPLGFLHLFRNKTFGDKWQTLVLFVSEQSTGWPFLPTKYAVHTQYFDADRPQPSHQT